LFIKINTTLIIY